MAYTGYECLDIRVDRGVATVTIDHPPINLYDLALIQEMDPGGSGTQRLPRLVGRSRALEIVLGCEDFPAELAERYGYLNRALPAAELGPFVERLARRIASFPAEAIALAKASVNAAELPTVEGLLEEAHYFNQSLATRAAQERMQRFLALGGQTREVELDLGGLVERLRD